MLDEPDLDPTDIDDVDDLDARSTNTSASTAEPPAGTFDVSDPSELVQEVEQFLRDRDEG